MTHAKRKRATMMMMAMLIAASGVASAATNQSAPDSMPDAMNEVVVENTTRASIAAGTADAAAVQAWLAMHAPSHLPRIQDAAIEVTRSVRTTLNSAQRAPSGAPPMPLPSNGVPGEEITISQTRPGREESWTFRWSASSTGGGWVLVAYRFKNFQNNPR